MNYLERAEAAGNRNFSLSASVGDLSGLGSDERNSPKAKARCGPSERARASHWAGVRCRRSQFPKPEEYRFYKGDPNNDIQPVSKEALIGAIKKCQQNNCE